MKDIRLIFLPVIILLFSPLYARSVKALQDENLITISGLAAAEKKNLAIIQNAESQSRKSFCIDRKKSDKSALKKIKVLNGSHVSAECIIISETNPFFCTIALISVKENE
ncbi:MAG: hypothetical protein IJR80_02050 [Treponema sp.]|nr:hypothetical protein [Treponema sp.]